MVEYVVERHIQIQSAGLPSRHREAVEQRLCSDIVLALNEHHRVYVVGHAGLRLRSESPPSEDFRKVRHNILIVGRYRIALHVELNRAVDIQLVEADREELKNLAPVILVWVELRTG